MTVVPNFILKRLYVPGSLRQLDEGVAFDLLNVIGPGAVHRVNGLTIGAAAYGADQIVLIHEENISEGIAAGVEASAISEASPFLVGMGKRVTCVVRGVTLGPGAYPLVLDVYSKDVGQVKLAVEDRLPS